MVVPDNPKIYHILHVDRLPYIINLDSLLSDSEVVKLPHSSGTQIGNQKIKARRLSNRLSSHPDLLVGNCVPFYFCPRSPMLYAIHKQSEELNYKGGQDSIVYLESSMEEAIDWLRESGLRYVFTTSNAGASSFHDYYDLTYLDRIDWQVIGLHTWWDWPDKQEAKEKVQAEFLAEHSLSWWLVSSVYVKLPHVRDQVLKFLERSLHKPLVQVKREWYF